MKHETVRDGDKVEYGTCWWDNSNKDIIINGLGLLVGFYSRPYLLGLWNKGKMERIS